MGAVLLAAKIEEKLKTLREVEQQLGNANNLSLLPIKILLYVYVDCIYFSRNLPKKKAFCDKAVGTRRRTIHDVEKSAHHNRNVHFKRIGIQFIQYHGPSSQIHFIFHQDLEWYK